jgi:predicted HTH domain antitoxin
LYQEVVVSLAEAATKAEVSLWEMMEYIHLKNIRPPVENPEEIEKELLESMN